MEMQNDTASAEGWPDKGAASPHPVFEAARGRTIWTMLADGAATHPDRVALVASSDAGDVQRLTYGLLAERVRNLSAGFAEIGVRHGDRVAIWMTNSLEWVVSAFAAMRLGAALTPVNTFLRPAEVAYFLKDSGARHIIILDSFRRLDFPAMLAEICPAFAEATEPGHLFDPALPDLRNVILFNRAGGSHAGAHDLASLERRGAANAQALALADGIADGVPPGALGFVKYTSGSTGFPKGVMLEQGGIVANGTLHSRRVGIDGSDSYFSMMPFFHAGGSIYGLMTMLPNGGKLIFTEAFHAERGIRLIADEQATIVVGILATEMVQAGIAAGITCPSVRIASGIGEHADRIFPNVSFAFQAFGLTETYGPVSIASPFDPEDKRRTCGRLLEGNEIRVLDPATGDPVPPGAPGEAWVRGNLMQGYWNKPDETARILKDGWLRTEDLVVQDEDGYLTWVGRLKLMLKVGGENVSLEEVERIISGHEAIAGCGAIGVGDPRKGEAVGLLVACHEEGALAEETLREWIAERMAMFKRPRRIGFVAELPRLGNGKLDRAALHTLAQAMFAA